VNERDSKAEIFDVFLCHNTVDKPAVREIALKLKKEGIKPWLDEADIRTGSLWHNTIGQQIESVKSVAFFLGPSGVGSWQQREIIALLDEFDKRGCPVIPVILPSDPPNPVSLPWSLKGYHCVYFRSDSQSLNRLIWGITGQKPKEFADVPDSEKPGTMREATKPRLVPGKARLYQPLIVPPDEEQAGQLEILRARVLEYWIDGVLKHLLYNVELISLGKRKVDKAIDAPWKYTVNVSDAMNSAALDDRDVTTVYNATGSLLILGEPGSGKTTTLLDLAQTLLERAKGDIKERVPVVLNLSSWKKKQPIAKWIVGELWGKYRVPRKIGRLWLQHGYLLPLLDGLDEIETVNQPDCVAAINAFIEESFKESKPSGLVVCCRLNEYRCLPERLKLNGAICIEPLSPGEVSKCLAAGGAKLAALSQALETDPVLQELSQTPLMLSIMSIAFHGFDIDELSRQKGNLEERRKQIFDFYVKEMFTRKGATSLVFPKEKIIDWLSWLAGKMSEHSQSVFLIEGLQPSWLGTRAKRIVYRTAVFLSLWLLLGLLLWLIFGLTFGLIFGLIGSFVVTPINEIHLVETVSWNWHEFWDGLKRMSLLALISGPLLGMIFGMIFGLRLGLIGGLFVVLASLLMVSLEYQFTCKVKDDKASPNQGIKLSLRNSSIVFLVLLSNVGLMIGLFQLFMGVGLSRTTGTGLFIGLLPGLRRGGSCHPALCVTTDSLVEGIYASQFCQVPRPMRQTYFPEESGWRLYLHPSDAARLLRRFDSSIHKRWG
jgi:hypothetical protein